MIKTYIHCILTASAVIINQGYIYNISIDLYNSLQDNLVTQDCW